MRRHLPLLLVLLAGCGDPLVSGGYMPPYYTLVARFSSAMPAPANTNIALWWDSESSGNGPNYVSQLVGRRDLHFPTVYNIDLNALPPPAAEISVGPAGADIGVDPHLVFARGTLVVYADNNDNEQLDIDPTDGKKSPDTVLGVAAGVNVFYLVSGQPAPPSLIGALPATTGFSLVSVPPRRDPLPGECDQFTAKGHESVLCDSQPVGASMLLPASTTIDIELTADPDLQRFACATFWGAVEPDWELVPAGEIGDGPNYIYCVGYTCPLDVPPADATVTCNSDGTAYTYTTCSDDASLCGTTFCHYGHGARLAADPIPGGWPCN